MATKGPSLQFKIKHKSNDKIRHFVWARKFNSKTLKKHGKKHKELGFKNYSQYEVQAIRFANRINKRYCKIFYDDNQTAYKINFRTHELAIIDKNGYIVTYYKVRNSFTINKIGGKEIRIKV